MMPITISNSMSVKPLDSSRPPVDLESCARESCPPRQPVQNEILLFMESQCLVERAGRARPIRQNATTYGRGREMGRSKQGSEIRGRDQGRLSRPWARCRQLPAECRLCRLKTILRVNLPASLLVHIIWGIYWR